ncbi:ATP-binding protein [Streptomyces sp. NPDC002523]
MTATILPSRTGDAVPRWNHSVEPALLPHEAALRAALAAVRARKPYDGDAWLDDAGDILDTVTASDPLTCAGAMLLSRTTELPGIPRAVLTARFWTRTTVAAMGWNGDMLRAVEVVSRLVDNGVRHGLPTHVPANDCRLSLTVSLTDADAMVFDVTDLMPAFPDSEAAIRGESGRGLWRVARLGARVTWFLPREGEGKTVRAVLGPGPVAL